MNTTGGIFVLDAATDSWTHTLDYDAAVQGRPFFCWFPPAMGIASTAFLVMTQRSIVLEFDWKTGTTYQRRLDMQNVIEIGWAGGVAVPSAGPSTWVTGKYNVVEIDTVELTVQSVQPILTGDTGGKFEPLCGDVPPDNAVAYFGSCTGGRTQGNGSLTAIYLPVPSGGVPGPQWFLDLGEDMHWPFQVVAGVANTRVFVFATAGVGVVNVDSRKVESFTPVDPATPLAELMCYNAARDMAAVKAGTTWQVWSLTGQPSPAFNVAEPMSSSHTCLFTPDGTALLVAGESVATGAAVVAKYVIQ